MDYKIPFSSRNFTFLKNLARDYAGLDLGDNKKWMIYSRLSHLLIALNIKSFDEYCNLLQQGNKEYLRTFVHGVTIHETQFFREEHHFEYLKNKFLPEFTAGSNKNSNLKILSAGCSTGQEPYSIGMSLLETMDSLALDPFILAVDIDSYVLELAEKGIYSYEAVKKVKKERLKRFFLKGKNTQKGYAKVKDELRRLIAFREMNLASNWSLRDQFDVIFCRNVILYFTKEVKEKVIEKFHQYLKPSGLLIMGYSEILDDFEKEFRLIGNSVYERIGEKEQTPSTKLKKGEGEL